MVIKEHIFKIHNLLTKFYHFSKDFYLSDIVEETFKLLQNTLETVLHVNTFKGTCE